jgi:hypothetical protein
MRALTEEQQKQLDALKTAWIAASIKWAKVTAEARAKHPNEDVAEAAAATIWGPVNRLMDTADVVAQTAFHRWSDRLTFTFERDFFRKPCLPWPPE